MISTEDIKRDFFKEFELPISYGVKEDFHAFIVDKLSDFRNFVINTTRALPTDLACIDRVTSCSSTIKLHIESIEGAIDEYYNGRPDKAFQIYEKTLDESLQILPIIALHKRSFYRIRTGDNVVNRKDIFHIPFSKRTLIANQRYSIAGFPCLYLSNSTYVAWEELHRPSIDSLNFAKLTFSVPLNFINFSPTDFMKRLEKTSDELQFFQEIILYPILLICSIKVSSPNNPFKPEYIFSQFTLRWCKEKDKYDGIMYGSTRVNNKSKGQFYNLVIPVSDYKPNTELCPDLTQRIKLTEPCNIQNIDVEKNTVEHINNDILEIFSKELHKVVSFDQSIFAKIEYHLESKELGSVTRT